MGCLGDHRSPGWRFRPNEPPPGAYWGGARVLAGTRVLAAPPNGEWAQFTADTSVEVRFRKGEKWVLLTVVPGLDDSLPGSSPLKAYAALEDVVFPEDVKPDGGP